MEKDRLRKVNDFALGIVVHACNPSYLGVRSRRIAIQDQLRQK
jgi:hypothetical protein